MRSILAFGTLVTLLAAGCVSPIAPNATNDPQVEGLTSVFTRASLPFDLTDQWSHTLVNGTFAILPVQSVFVSVALPPTSLGSAVDSSAKVHMGLWLPDVPAGTKVPVIADIGPYYADGDKPAIEPADRLGKFLIDNFVSHGYAVAQVSVFGSGDSTHCMDLMGPDEQKGVDAAVTYLGSQEWSNGNVGLIGRSYDGSTPWEAAMFPNEHLKTIVPISGLTGAYELMWRNGSAETRGPIMHNVVYGQFGIDQDPADAYNACASYLTGPANGAAALVTGEPVTPYWQDRYFFDAALKNYKGSVYLIHGLQDWNVDPHVALPRFSQLAGAGLETKALLGQWAHNYPDRASEHEKLGAGRGKEAFPTMTRMDWAQDLLEWFNYYLQGTGPKPLLHVEVQDNMGDWRVEDSWPPTDANWSEMKLTGAGGPVGPQLSYVTILPPISMTEDSRIAGLPQLHLKVTPLGPGGQVFAIISDAETKVRLGHAIMDLRFAAGGDSMQPVVPGMQITAKMEFEPLDVVLPAGHGILIELSNTGEDYLPSATSAPVQIDAAASILRLPIVTPAAETFFHPPNPVGPTKGDSPTS